MDKKKSKQQDVLVIGAGASGMMTAITAARRGLFRYRLRTYG